MGFKAGLTAPVAVVLSNPEYAESMLDRSQCRSANSNAAAPEGPREKASAAPRLAVHCLGRFWKEPAEEGRSPY